MSVLQNILRQTRTWNEFNSELPLSPTHSELRHGFYIISGKKSFAVYAATATEKSEWMAHIQKCVADLIAKGKSVSVRRSVGPSVTRFAFTTKNKGVEACS